LVDQGEQDSHKSDPPITNIELDNGLLTSLPTTDIIPHHSTVIDQEADEWDEEDEFDEDDYVFDDDEDDGSDDEDSLDEDELDDFDDDSDDDDDSEKDDLDDDLDDDDYEL